MDIGKRCIGFLGQYTVTTSKELNHVDLLTELLYTNSATGKTSPHVVMFSLTKH